MGKLILVRHGESKWNKKQIFTGWADVSLTSKGIRDVQKLAIDLKRIKFDVMFTSRLERARSTLLTIVSEQDKVGIFVHQRKRYNAIFDDNQNIPIFSHRDLNERYYGLLQGMEKEYARKKFGDEQVFAWRRSYETRPPQGENLHDVYDRVVPYFQDNIWPLLLEDKTILVSAHGNSLRALIKYIDKINDEDITRLNLAPGDFVSYTIVDEKLKKDGEEHEFTRPVNWKE